MATSSGFGTLEVPLLTGKNYELWCIRMQVFLQGQGVLEFVDSGFIAATDEELEGKEDGIRGSEVKRRKCKLLYYECA